MEFIQHKKELLCIVTEFLVNIGDNGSYEYKNISLYKNINNFPFLVLKLKSIDTKNGT